MRLIDADALEEEIRHAWTIGACYRFIENAPTIKAAPIDVLDNIRAEIERLHYHPKLDFIKNDEVVEMALDIIDKYKAESEDSN